MLKRMLTQCVHMEIWVGRKLLAQRVQWHCETSAAVVGRHCVGKPSRGRVECDGIVAHRLSDNHTHNHTHTHTRWTSTNPWSLPTTTTYTNAAPIKYVVITLSLNVLKLKLVFCKINARSTFTPHVWAWKRKHIDIPPTPPSHHPSALLWLESSFTAPFPPSLVFRSERTQFYVCLCVRISYVSKRARMCVHVCGLYGLYAWRDPRVICIPARVLYMCVCVWACIMLMCALANVNL